MNAPELKVDHIAALRVLIATGAVKGRVVEYSGADALEIINHLDSIAAAIADLTAKLDEAQGLIYAARLERNAAEDAEKELAEQLRTVKRQLAEAREVKPLVWNGKPSDFYMFADTDLGMYEIGVEYGDEWFCDFTAHRAGKPVRLSNCQDGPTAPQTVAQADYTARILFALKGTP